MIREYLLADVDAIFVICKASPEAAQWAKENYERAEANGQIILVAEDAGKILGFLVARVIANEAEILNMAVDPGQRRQGTGSALLLATEERARKHDAIQIYLEVRESNTAARAFYERHGFQSAGARPKYYVAPTENAVLMEKKVTG
jgi:ribosomal-protein-alanine acetyltransferase